MNIIYNFFNTFLTIVAQNTATILSICVFFFLLYIFVISKPGRILLCGIKDAILDKLSTIPFFAKGIYSSKIKKYYKMLDNMREAQQQALGELNEKRNQLYNEKQEYKKNIKRAKSLLKMGQNEDAISISKRIMQIQSSMQLIEKETIPRLEGTASIAQKRIEEIQNLIQQLETSREQSLYELKLGKIEKSISDALIGDGTDEESQLLKNFEKNARNHRNLGVGARMSYELSPEQKMAKIDADISEQEAISFLQSLTIENKED